jgi:SMODS-associating 2TM, beta-strand rich effector domain
MKTQLLSSVQSWILASSVAYGVLLYACGVRLEGEAKELVPYLPTAMGFLLIAFDKWMWRWCFIQPFVGRPLLRGTWLVTIRPSAKSHIPAGGNRGPIEGAMVIEQNFFSVHVTQYTGESTSQSGAAVVQAVGESAKQAVLAFVYANRPKQEHRARSPNHDGACQLEAVGDAPVEMRGHYWTSRFTAGDLELQFVDRTLDYSTAAQVRASYDAQLAANAQKKK